MARASDKLRDQEHPTVLGYELDRETLTPLWQPIDLFAPGDYGADPLEPENPDGLHRMVPSGDIVTLAERMRRLAHLSSERP